MHLLTERNQRQQDILPPDRLAEVRASVIGVGAIGRQVAIQLAAVGVPRLQLIDFDQVEPVNLAAQAFLESDLGETKVNATARFCHRLNSLVEIEAIPERFRRGIDVGSVVFSCVDSIATRKAIWRLIEPHVDLFIDGRMSAEVIRILTASDAKARRHYPSTLFASSEAYTGACTARSTVFTANVAAGLMIEQFARWLRRLPLDADLMFNLLTSECSVQSA